MIRIPLLGTLLLTIIVAGCSSPGRADANRQLRDQLEHRGAVRREVATLVDKGLAALADDRPGEASSPLLIHI